METSLRYAPSILVLLAACAAPADDASESTVAADSAGSVIDFGEHGAVAHPATIAVGAPVVVTYNVSRLATCGVLSPGASSPASIDLFYLTKSGHTHVALGGDWADASHTVARATIGPFNAQDAGDLQLWFHATNAHGCEAWDSASGHNYHFTLGAAAKPFSEIAPILHQTCGGCHGDQFSTLDRVRSQRSAMLSRIEGGAMPQGNPGWKDTDHGRAVLTFLSASPELQ